MIQFGTKTLSYYQFINHLQDRYGDNFDKIQSPITETCNEKGDRLPKLLRITNIENNENKLVNGVKGVMKHLNCGYTTAYNGVYQGKLIKKKYRVERLDISIQET